MWRQEGRAAHAQGRPGLPLLRNTAIAGVVWVVGAVLEVQDRPVTVERRSRTDLAVRGSERGPETLALVVRESVSTQGPACPSSDLPGD